MGEGIIPAQGTVGEEDARVPGTCDPRGCSYTLCGERPPVLVHGSACHPVGSIGIGGGARLPDGIGKYPASRDDQKGTVSGSQGRDNLPEMGSKAAAQFHDRYR